MDKIANRISFFAPRLLALKSLKHFCVVIMSVMSLTLQAQYQGIQVRDSICAGITYVSSLPSNYPGENFTYQWLPNNLMVDNTVANPIFVLPFGNEQLSYLRIRTGNTGVYYDTLRLFFLDSYPFDVNTDLFYCPNGVNTIFLNETQGALANPPVFINPVADQPFTYQINITSPNITQFPLQLINEFGCATFPYTINVTVAETIAVSIPPLPDLMCLGSPSIELLPGFPAGGSYLVNGIPNTTFNPSVFGIGLHQIQYLVSENSCSYILKDSIEVVNVNNISITEVAPLCASDEPVLLSNVAIPTGGIFRINNIEVTEFNPSLYPPGGVTVNYTYELNENCTSTIDFLIFIKPPPPKPNIVTFTGFNEFCFGDSVVVGVNPYPNIIWSNGQTVPSFTVNSTQNLTVTYTSSLGCTNSDTALIVELNPLLLNLTSPTYGNGFEISVYEGNDGSITATSGGGFPPYSFVEADLGLFTPPLVNLTANTYTITVSDSRGCRATDSIILRQPDKVIIIEPEKPDFIAIPNSFTPNGDGYNDFWVFKNIIIAPNNRLSVYNRWGDLIYSANNYQNNWNGSVKEGVTETTYFYVFEDLTNNKSYKGYVQVVVRN